MVWIEIESEDENQATIAVEETETLDQERCRWDLNVSTMLIKFIIDSGATDRIINDKRYFSNMRSYQNLDELLVQTLAMKQILTSNTKAIIIPVNQNECCFSAIFYVQISFIFEK